MTTVFLTTTGAQTWTVPGGVISAKFDCYGGGGGAKQNSGGGGGAYASVTLTVTPGATVFASVGVGGTSGSSVTAGGSSWVNISSNATPSSAAQGALAVGGGAPVGGVAPGGAAASCIGTTTTSGGGANYNSSEGFGGSGGGGCGGPLGNGSNGGSNNLLSPADAGGGGGGAAQNGATGAGQEGGAHAANQNGGTGGTGTAGAGGTAGSGSAGGNAATNGGGGGGGGAGTTSGAPFAGGNGAIDASVYGAGNPGPGGGGGGGGGTSTTNTAGSGGTASYGGGAAGAGANSNLVSGTSPNGGQGFIAITYTVIITGGFAAQAPDLQWHPPVLDTNQPQLTFSGLAAFATPSARWWMQPPDLLRHVPELWSDEPRPPPEPAFPNQTTQSLGWWLQSTPLPWSPQALADLSAEMTFGAFNPTPLIFWYTQPPDLVRHPAHLDTNQPRLVSQQFAEPGIWWWTQPPDLLRHSPELWTPALYWPSLPGLPGLDIPALWWTQPPDLLAHPPPLDTNQQRLVSQALATPGMFWWAQPPDLLRRAPHLDTNQLTLPFAGLQRSISPSAFWWSQPPDLLRHAAHLDTNQLTMPFAGLSPAAVPCVLWWAQPPDLLHRGPYLDTNEPQLTFAAYQAFAPPASLAFFRQPPDTPRRFPELAPAGPYIGPMAGTFTPSSLSFWTQPQFQQPRAPDLWAGQPYEPQGWQLNYLPWLLPPPPFGRPLPPHQAPQPLIGYYPFPITPKMLASFSQPFLAEHARELITWQFVLPFPFATRTPVNATYFGQPQDLLRKPAGDIAQPWTHIVGWRYPFLGAAFIAARPKLSTAVVKPRSLIAANTVRRRKLTPTQTNMRTPDLSPILAGVEIERVTFDFGLICLASPGNTISAIISVNCLIDSGVDTLGQTRLLSVGPLIASPMTGAANCAFTALFGNMLAGVTYLLQAVVTTADGQELATEARWPCVAVM
jgi:hypothetical protein